MDGATLDFLCLDRFQEKWSPVFRPKAVLIIDSARFQLFRPAWNMLKAR